MAPTALMWTYVAKLRRADSRASLCLAREEPRVQLRTLAGAAGGIHDPEELIRITAPGESFGGRAGDLG